jgi:hypothetical protein
MKVLALFAVSLLMAAANFPTPAPSKQVDGRTFKAVFTLTADDALLTHENLTLSGVHSQVFVVESEGNEAVGVTAPATPFLERWQSIDHSITPQGILFAHTKQHADPYQAIDFTIDAPKAVTSSEANSWTFEVTHTTAEAPDELSEGLALGPVTLTIVMVHTQKEFDRGLVCGPWDLASLRHHLELFH